MMRRYPAWFLGAGLALTLWLLWWRVSTPHQPTQAQFEPLTPRAPVAAMASPPDTASSRMGRIAPESPTSADPTNAEAWQGEIRIQGSQECVGDGRLFYSDVLHDAFELRSVNVTAGRFRVGEADALMLLTLTSTPAAIRFTEIGGPPVPCRQVEVQAAGQSRSLLLSVSPPVALTVLVSNLRGDPVPGANVRLGLPVVPSTLPCDVFTDASGIASFRAYGLGSSARIRVQALGYATKSAQVDLQADQLTQEIHLPRLLGFGTVRDRRIVGLSERKVIPFDVGMTAPAESWKPITEGRDWSLQPHDRLSFFICWEQEWISETSVRVDALNLISGNEQTLLVPFRHIIDPEFAVVRLPELEGPPAGPLRLRFLPASAFLTDPPDEMTAGFELIEGDYELPPPLPSTDTSAARWYVGKRVEDQVYEFWLPLGRYRVVSPRDLSAKAALGDDSPQLLPAEVSVLAGADPALTFDVSLAPGECYLRYALVDPSGLPIDLAAMLALDDGRKSARIWPDFGGFPRPRWVRPGNYVLWARDATIRRVAPIVKDIIWPSSTGPDGQWKLVIPDALDPNAAVRYP